MDILAYCENPRTLKELCGHFGVSHMTIRKELEKLEIAGVLKEQAWRRGNEKLYKTLLNTTENLGTYNLRFGDKGVPPVGLLYYFEEDSLYRVTKIPRFIIAKLLAEYATRMRWAIPDRIGVDGYPAAKDAKKLLKPALKYAEALVSLLHDLDSMPVWDNLEEWAPILWGSRDIKNEEELWKGVKETLGEFSRTIEETNWTEIMNPELFKG